MTTPTPELPDGSFVRTGDRHPYKWWERDDGANIESGYGAGHHWWDCAYDDGGPDGPLTWEEILAQSNPMLIQLTPLDE